MAAMALAPLGDAATEAPWECDLKACMEPGVEQAAGCAGAPRGEGRGGAAETTLTVAVTAPAVPAEVRPIPCEGSEVCRFKPRAESGGCSSAPVKS